ncbi:MAG: SWF/SNF helicase family protein, partial [Acidobacteria bacterium]|nr:SWF/SNF helicase family protein [Acidobacteriota bacterium]
MLVEQQIAERRERAKTAIARILKRPDARPFGDYQVKSASGRIYRVALRRRRGERLQAQPHFTVPGIRRAAAGAVASAADSFGGTGGARASISTRPACCGPSRTRGSATCTELRRGKDPLAGVLKTRLLPYQVRGPFSLPPAGAWSWPTTWAWARPYTRWPTCCIQNMRMLCNSTFLFDKATHHSPKLEEFREIIRELVLEEGRKVVVFSQYQRMTHLAGQELGRLGIGFVSLHGSVPARKRGELIGRFRDDPACKVFLSTDAGGVGLNLQAASAVIDFEPPWNPARLEQRIGRVHRLGQQHPVQVIHFLTTDSIEERVWETIQLKKSLFAGVFDSAASEISFAKLGRKSVLQAVKEVFAEQTGRHKPVVETPPPAPVPVETVAAAAGGFLEAGIRFLETLVSSGTPA